jgi:hypothetical protein
MNKSVDFDPPEAMREYFRHKVTGDKGYLVIRDGEKHIRYDRPYDPTTMKFRESEWVPDSHPEPFSIGQAIQVAFDADRSVCRLLGMHLEARKSWQNLSEKERSRFILHGPEGPQVRKEMFLSIKQILSPLTRRDT